MIGVRILLFAFILFTVVFLIDFIMSKKNKDSDDIDENN